MEFGIHPRPSAVEPCHLNFVIALLTRLKMNLASLRMKSAILRPKPIPPRWWQRRFPKVKDQKGLVRHDTNRAAGFCDRCSGHQMGL